jgi:tRNA pseudouridine38-40 synthase
MEIEYDGGCFSGWQWQKDEETVQGLIESGIYELWKEEVRVTGAGRTDAGVHAWGQVAHVDIEREVSPRGLMMGLNYAMRGKGCVIKALGEARDDFHARFDARVRGYCYRILNRVAPPSVTRGYVWHYPWSLDLGAMQEVGLLLESCEDFSAFRASGCQALSAKKTLDMCRIEREGEEIKLTFVARSFLYRQVRIMVGTLVEVGRRGGRDVSWVKNLVEGGTRKDAGPTVPPWGLALTHVGYGERDTRDMSFSIDKRD